MANLCFIALVDDHVLLRHGLASLINSFEGYNVLFEADNGKEFINRLQPSKIPDIILLDITMPIMNGYETAQWIKVNLPNSKILVLSMMDNDIAIIRMLKLGSRGYILKDCKPSVLNEALNQIRDNGYFMNELVSNRMLKYIHDGADENDTRFLKSLTDRELVFLKLVCSEKSYKEIASEMFISPRTVESYRDNLFEKLAISSRSGLVMYAIKNGIVIP